MISANRSVADTIVAVSSPPGRSYRGLIRISGDAARPVLAALLAQPTLVARLVPRTLTPLRLADPSLPALVVLLPGPRSVTAQDVVELQTPGHPSLLERLLHHAVAAGARLAEPGEFTFRAFAAGRLDLTQAEGVAATIAATSDAERRAAELLREGRLGRAASELVDSLATLLALVEAGIDFVDQEDVVPIRPGELAQRLDAVAGALDDVLSRSRAWGELEALPRVVLVGRPSAGKSTLFNALLGRPRAVVSDMPGTTRDVLEEPLTLRDDAGRAAEILLVDLAGLDAPGAPLDERAQHAAREAIRRAELILHVRAADDPLVHSPIDLPDSAPRLDVLSKSDLRSKPRAERSEAPDRTTDIGVSAHTGAGLDALRSAIRHRLGDRAVSLAADTLALQPRHAHALRTARERLAAALTLLEPQRHAHALDHVELVAGELRTALDALASLGGRMSPDDVIGRVFATFCVGK